MYTFSDEAKQAVWNTLIAQPSHYFESRVGFSSNPVNWVGQDQIIALSTQNRLFSSEQPGVGGCMSGELSLTLIKPGFEIPRMCLVRPYVRVTDGTTYSEWMPQGVFYIDTREVTANGNGLDILTLHCYDAMLKAEADYPGTSHNWPYSDWNTVKEISYFMGLSSTPTGGGGVDSRTRTLMDKSYMIDLPAGYTMREVLSQIAAMYAGNFVMTYDGKLLLVALDGIPPETNYLIDNGYDAITFGGDRILV